MATREQTRQVQEAAAALAEAAALLVDAILAERADAAEIRRRHEAGEIGFLVEVNELKGLALVSTWTRTEQEQWLGYVDVDCRQAFAPATVKGSEGDGEA